jgi:hypothetical protein
MLVRGLALTGVSAVLAVLVAGCGGSKSPSVASIPTTTSPPGQTKGASTTGGQSSERPSAVVLATCLRSHGLTAVVGSPTNASQPAISLAGVVVTGTDPSSPRFQSAMQACRKYMPGGGPPQMSPTQKAEWVTAMTAFAGCMRKNGVPSFPDPTGAGTFPSGFLENVDPGSEQFQSALSSCQKLEPSFGPRIG